MSRGRHPGGDNGATNRLPDIITKYVSNAIHCKLTGCLLALLFHPDTKGAHR